MSANPSITLQDLQASKLRSAALWNEVSRQRQQLSDRIGPRGLMIGTFVARDGKGVPVHVGSPNEFKKLWKCLPDEIRGDKFATMEAVRAACARWDEEADRVGLLDLQAKAMTARDRFRSLLKDWSRETTGAAQ